MTPMLRRNAIFAGALSVILLAGFSTLRCAADEPSGSTSATTTPESSAHNAASLKAGGGGAEQRGGAPQTTALRTSVFGEPLYARGSDGKVHLEYDLLSTSVFRNPVRLIKVEVLAANGQRLLNLEGDDLKARTQPLGDTTPTSKVPPSGAVATLIDIVVAPDKVPDRLTNRVAYELTPDTPDISKALIDERQIEGPKLQVVRRQPTVIAPPLSGEGWFNANGCCEPTPHRSFRLAADGERYVTPETFAIDWVRLRGKRIYEGDATKNQQYFDFGAKVSSATDGEVVSVRDGMSEETPNNDPTDVRMPGDFGGNHVVVRVRPGVYAFYAHLQPGSIEVRKGDQVKAGQPLGRLGNTGNSTAPHLHFELSDGPDVLTSNSLPFVIDRYELAGSVAADSTDTSMLVKGTLRSEEKTHPLFLSVANFR